MTTLPTLLFLISTLPGFILAQTTELRSEVRTEAAHHRKSWCVTCERTPAGRIKRNSKARANFIAANPCPSERATAHRCPGYVVDHIKPLKRGGEDRRANMQSQTKEDAKA